MANNNNVVKIGTALKWRGLFELDKRYYQENMVTVCGSVFRCAILQSQNISPVEFDEEGHMTYVNPDVWELVVDYAYYYNFAVDTRNLTEETLAYVKKLDQDIKALQAEQLEQWRQIAENTEVNNQQWDEIYDLKSRAKDLEDAVGSLNEGGKTLQEQINEIREKDQEQDNRLDNVENKLGNYQSVYNPEEKTVWGMLQWLEGLIFQLHWQQPETTAPSVVENGLWDNTLPWEDDKYWNNYKLSNMGSCGCGNIGEQLESLQQRIKELEELLDGYKGNPVIVKSYDEVEQKMELAGAISVTDYDEKEEQATISVPETTVVYHEPDLSLEFL